MKKKDSVLPQKHPKARSHKYLLFLGAIKIRALLGEKTCSLKFVFFVFGNYKNWNI